MRTCGAGVAKVSALDDADELGVCGVARHLIAFHEVP
jgi:hypothetical protein